MGEALNPQREYILIVLPFPEPTEILLDLRKKHPLVDINYVFQGPPTSQVAMPVTTGVPDEEYSKATIIATLFSLPAHLRLAPRLKLIHLFSAGSDHLSKSPFYQDTDIPITTSSGIHGPQIAEWVILQLLSFSHKQKLLIQYQKDHKWGKDPEVRDVRDYVGQRLGVLGYGSIGRQTARVARALGLDVIAFTASPRTTPESKKDRGYIVPGTGDVDGTVPSAWYSGLDKTSLHHFLAQDIDVLLISVPLTAQTRHFLGKEEFEILGRKNALVVNIARGSIVVQDELVAALKRGEGGLRGAALDVTDPEPLNEDSELWDLENVAVTPHVSGAGTSYVERSFEILERNLSNLEEGRRLLNEVNRKRGY